VQPNCRETGVDVLLDGLPAADERMARNILAGAPHLLLEPGALNLPPGARTAPLLLVDAGFVVLRSLDDDASRSVLTSVAGAGRLVVPAGEHETLESLVESRLIVVTEEVFRCLLEVPTFARVLIEALVAALRQSHEAIANFASTRHLDRVRRLLVQFARAYGKVGPDGVRIDFPISHMLLAEMIGSSRETVTRAVDELQRTGLLKRCGRSYRLLTPAVRTITSV
jgi:CRP-like cAMP-binding protein